VSHTTSLAENYAYFLETSQQPSTCKPEEPLSVFNITVHRIEPEETFNVADWQASNSKTETYKLGVKAGTLFAVGNGGNIY